MKKARRFITIFTLCALMSTMIISAGAVSGDWLANSKTKSTAYGTITGELYRYVNDSPYAVEMTAKTSINSASNMTKVTTTISCVYNDTGSAEGNNWTRTSTSNNAKSNSVDLDVYPEIGRRLCVYTSHQIIYTTSEVLYMTTLG